jgi:hypothetical protein
MSKTQEIKYVPVDASPVKSFFVSMLTRDIKLEDAILDLLDNCVDGILRSKHKAGNKPYSGYWAEIGFNKDLFSISDNCGGIPWSMHDYAFKMGKVPGSPNIEGGVGVYGIGMKRAVFKMGRNCIISTRSGNDEYEVDINRKWISDEGDWKIPVKQVKTSMKDDGTTIVIGDLYQGISERFSASAESFKTDLVDMVATHYSFIIDKGFEVKINGDPVKPRTVKLIFDNRSTEGIKPYVFKTRTSDGVEVFLTVGFTRGIPSQSEILDEQESTRYSSIAAGWTIICNDRAVVYCNKDELTGWGEAGVPRYHTQFIAISGIVEFRSKDASKLPTTTTKRGIDASSPLYLQIKNKMREGMRIFTDYTNKWKGREDESRKQIEKGTRLSLIEVKTESESLPFHATKQSVPAGDLYKPKLPLPVVEATKRRVSFVKEVTKIKKVAEYFGDSNMEPSDVGAKCFDTIYEEARK